MWILGRADRVYCIMGDLKIVNVQSLLVFGALKLYIIEQNCRLGSKRFAQNHLEIDCMTSNFLGVIVHGLAFCCKGGEICQKFHTTK